MFNNDINKSVHVTGDVHDKGLWLNYSVTEHLGATRPRHINLMTRR